MTLIHGKNCSHNFSVANVNKYLYMLVPIVILFMSRLYLAANCADCNAPYVTLLLFFQSIMLCSIDKYQLESSKLGKWRAAGFVSPSAPLPEGENQGGVSAATAVALEDLRKAEYNATVDKVCCDDISWYHSASLCFFFNLCSSCFGF